MILKRAQVSLFVVIGVILLIIASFSYILSIDNTKVSKNTVGNYNADPIKLLVESCISNRIEQGVFLNSYSGGYYDIYRYDGANITAPYLFYNNNSYMPSLSTVEKGIASYINDTIGSCLDSSLALNYTNISIDKRSMDFKVTITEHGIDASAAIPIIIRSSGREIQLKDFSVSTPIPYKKVYDSASSILSMMKDDPTVIPVSQIQEFALEKGFFFNMANLDNGTLLNNLEFDKFYDGRKLVFAYAVKYDQA